MSVKVKARLSVLMLLMWTLLAVGHEPDDRDRGSLKTEEEKQTAFQQLLGKTGRLRMKAHETAPKNHVSSTTTTQSPSTGMLMLADQHEPKRHDRKHASSGPKHKNKDPNKRQNHAGRHICTHEEVVTRPVRVVESYCKPAYKSFTQRCTNGTMCTAFKVQFDTIYRTVVKYHQVTEKKHACCPGWTYHTPKHTHSCSQAICSKGCKNGGTCIKPEICLCAPGYNGPSCENDVDECSTANSNRCQQACINTIGSYQCSCHDGFHLLDDGRSCKFRLESVPELQALLVNYEAMSKRIAVLEQESREKISFHQPPVTTAPTVIDSIIANMTQHILILEDRLTRLNETTMMVVSNSSTNNSLESHSDSALASLSEQVGILEERLADCTCTTSSSPDNQVKTRN